VVERIHAEEMGNGQRLARSPHEVKTVQLVEQHCIDKRDPRYRVIDEAAFKSKNLYNAALYEIRQAFMGYMSGPILKEGKPRGA
jgi:hypothetical protein